MAAGLLVLRGHLQHYRRTVRGRRSDQSVRSKQQRGNCRGLCRQWGHELWLLSKGHSISVRADSKKENENTLGENYEKPDPAAAPGFTSVSDPAGEYGGFWPAYSQRRFLHQHGCHYHELRCQDAARC